MNPKFSLTVMFLMFRISILKATGQCRLAEYSVGGMFLRGHTFKTCRVGLHESCYFKCDEEVTCQSCNVVIGQNICELNNRTKEARPEDFLPDGKRYYMKRFTNRGTLEISCLFLKASTRSFLGVSYATTGSSFVELGPFQTPLHSCAEPN